MLSGLKVIQVFWPNEHCFFNIYMFFAWIFICRLHRGYKKVSTKISFSYQFTTILMDQLLCNVMLYIYISVLVKDRFYVYFVYGISSPTFSWLAALNYFLLQQSPFSFLQCRSKMRKQRNATPASLSRVVCLRLSKQSSVTARTNFSSQVLVLPAQERFSFKVYVFSKECLILFKGKQNNTLNFYCLLHKLLFSENTWNRITLNVVYFQQMARHIFTCKAMHFCGLISKLMVLLYTAYLETSAS